jgi:hypothetical protein
MNAPKWKHRTCPCGCGELADECMKPASGLNAFRLTPLYDAAAWAAGFAPLDDDASHAAECARYDQAAAALADDNTDGGRWVE